MWDDYDHYHNPDEDNWERFINSRESKVMKLIELLYKLNVLMDKNRPYNEYGWDVSGFVARNWKGT